MTATILKLESFFISKTQNFLIYKVILNTDYYIHHIVCFRFACFKFWVWKQAISPHDTLN